MKVHYKVRTNGSSGCIVFTDQEQWDKFTGWMEKRLKDCPTLQSRFPECKAECKDENYVPLKVDYFCVLPVLKLKGSEANSTVGACSLGILLKQRESVIATVVMDVVIEIAPTA
jgi:hypothetical protein